MPFCLDACLDHHTTSTTVVLFDNVRGLISTPGFSPDESTSRVTVQTESRLITEENSPPIILFPIQTTSALFWTEAHHANLWFTIKGMQTIGFLAYRPPALSLWVTVIREMDILIIVYRLLDSCVAVANLSLLARSLKKWSRAGVVVFMWS
ncbi:hypothetical protein TNCV_1950031 [Trichonephila clavipes]|nr:hypothetical protein TNCV_1950031 [Trichonephila clavipes]